MSDFTTLNFGSDVGELVLTHDTNTISFDTTGSWNDSGLVLDSARDFAADRLADTSISWIGGAQNHVSPLVFDLDGDGVDADLRHIYDDGTVYFDIDADGFAERVGWTGPDDGQLAMDRNGDGIINDITELYGDDVMPAFDKLRLHDSNGDRVLDATDADWGDLLVWRDLNQNGVSEAGELQTLDEVGIVSIDLNDSETDYYVKENYISNVATFELANGETREIADVHYLNDNLNTWALGAQSQVFGSTATINIEALLLPQSRGYGSLPALHLAMTGDPELKALVKQLDGLAFGELDQLGPLVEQILFRWADVQDNDPTARDTGAGSNIDSRKVDFLEEFGGVTWAQRGVTPLVGVNASLGIKMSWLGVHTMISARLAAQGPLESVFGESSYDFAIDQLVFTDALTVMLDRAEAEAALLTLEEAETFWATLGDTMVALREPLAATVAEIEVGLSAKAGYPLFLASKTISEEDGVLASFEGSPTEITVGVHVGDAANNEIIGSSGEQVIFGEGGDDLIEAGAGDDFARGDAGSDSLRGGYGYDRLEGGEGDDTLEGGADRDILRGGEGADELHGGDGDDNLAGDVGADLINGGEGFDQVDYSGSDVAVIVDLAAGTASGGHAQGDTLISIEGVNGSQLNDAISGDDQYNVLNGERGDDTLYGRGGDDNLFGATGDDRLFGGAGDDFMQGFEGAEHFDGGTGVDTVSYNHAFLTGGVFASLETGMGSAGGASGDTYVGVENLIGGDGADV